MAKEVIGDILLALAVLTVALASLGVATAPNAYARLHYVTPAAVVAPVLVALAVLVTEGLDENTGETVLALVFLIAASPFLSHATIRAMHWSRHGTHPSPSCRRDQSSALRACGARRRCSSVTRRSRCGRGCAWSLSPWM